MASSLLAQLRNQMTSGTGGGSSDLLSQLRAQRDAGLGEHFVGPALQRVADLGGVPQQAFGSLGINSLADFLTSKLMGEDQESVRAAREAFQAQEDAAVREKLAVPAPETKSQMAAQLLGSVAPDIALGAASAPIFAAGRAAAAGAGARPLAATFAGEAAQSAALAPLEFATRSPEEAAAVTALAPIAGTVVGRGVSGLLKLLRRGGADAVGSARMPHVEGGPGRTKADAEAKLQSKLESLIPALQKEVDTPEFKAEYREKLLKLLDDPRVPPEHKARIQDVLAEQATAVNAKRAAGGTNFSQEAAGRALARMRHSLETGTPMRAGDLIEMGDDVAEQLAREVRQEALQKSVALIRQAGASEGEIASSSAQLGAVLEKVDPTSAGIISDSISTLPPAAANKFAQQVGGGFRDKVATLGAQIREFRAASMLSGFGTHVRNIVGNQINIAAKPIRTLGAAAIDLPIAAITGKRQRFFSEAVAETAGMSWSIFKGLPSALRQAGLQSRAVRETLEGGAIPGLAGKVIRTPLRALNATDRFFFDKVFAGEMFRQSARQAAKEGVSTLRAPQRIGEILAQQDQLVQQIAKINSRVTRAEDLLAQAPASLTPAGRTSLKKFIAKSEAEVAALQKGSFVKDAAMMADRTIFTAREGELLDKALDDVDKWSKLVPVIDLVLPFRRTPANIVRETLRSSPVGFMTGASRAIRSTAQGAPTAQIQGRFADDMGQALIGTASMYALLHYAAEGVIKVNPFKEKARAERVTEESAGIVPDSVLVGNWSIPVSRLEPIGSQILAAARVAELREGDTPPPGLTEELEQMATILATQGANETFMDPLSEFFEAASGDDRLLNRWAQGLGASFVPRAVSQFSTSIKEPISDKDVAEAGVPGVLGHALAGVRRQIPGTGQADLGLFGKERKVQAPALSMAIGRSGELGNNPIAQEMVRVGAHHLPPNGLSTDFKAKLSKRGIGYSDEEDRTLRVVKGRAQERGVQQVVQSPRYQQLPPTPAGDAVRKQLIDNAFNQASKLVDQRVKALKLNKIPLTERAILGR